MTTMRVDRLTELAEWLEAGAPERDGIVGFDMTDFTTESACGTLCCLAGAANAFANYPVLRSEYNARLLLGLDVSTANKLFSPDFPAPSEWGTVTPDWAARCIRELIATGRVDWEGTRHV